MKPLELAQAGRREAVQAGRDVLLVDTAGRQHIDDQLMKELQELKEALEPDRDPVRGRRHDRAGRRQVGRRVPQAPGYHRRHSDQNGWRRAWRRGAFDPIGHRAAAEVRRRR